MSTAQQLADFAHTAGEISAVNRLINGGFDIWQRGTSFTATGYTADRWRMAVGSGAAATLSRQAFTVGQTDVAGEPRYFLRLNRTTTGSTATTLEQRIEGVRTLAGKEITVSFDAKAGSAITLNTLMRQDFGSGGGPSSDVDSDAGDHSLTTSWQRLTRTLTLASISGKTLGSGDNDYLSLIFSLPTAAGTVAVDIANVQVEPGAGDTPFEQRPLWAEIALCQRYFEKSFNLETEPADGETGLHLTAAGFNTAAIQQYIPYKVRKRGANPSVTFYRSNEGSAAGEWAYHDSGWNDVTDTVAARKTEDGFTIDLSESGAFTIHESYLISGHWTADAEL